MKCWTREKIHVKESVGVKRMSHAHVMLILVQSDKRHRVSQGRRDRRSEARCKTKVRCEKR